MGESAFNLNDFPSSTEAMTWNGKSWKLAATPNRGTSDALSGVSCTTPTTCVAVGSSSNGFPSGKTLVEVSSG